MQTYREIYNFYMKIFLVLSINFHAVLSDKSESLRSQPRIVIIGAGAAGIAAASKLFENGFNNVTILEAENRIGGRIYTIPFGNRWIDLGAEWVHGETGNVVFELANPLDLLSNNDTSNVFAESEMFDSSGNLVDSNIVQNLLEFYNTNLGHHVIRNNVESVGEFVKSRFAIEFGNNSRMVHKNAGYLHFLEMLALGYDAADSWYQLSAAGFEEFEKFPGEQDVKWKTRGYSTILDILMKRYPDPNKELPVINNTILQTEVQTINYFRNSGGSPISIVTVDEQEYLADHVIVTVSLGVLKEKHQSLFNPPLSPQKTEFIKSFGFGNVGKIYLYLEKSFLRAADQEKLISFVWNDADRMLIENTEKAWLLGIVYAIEYKFNIIELWISGKYAAMMEIIPEKKALKHTQEFFQQFLGKTFNNTHPVAISKTRWLNNPHFRGTYSYRSVEAERRKVYPKVLEEPIPSKTLDVLFAGEATSQHRFSTVDGAIKSGWKAAERLIHFYKDE